MTKEERAKEAKRWMDWYYNRGGREKVLARRNKYKGFTKQEYLKMVEDEKRSV